MSIPELIIGFFKSIFYVFYYSGYGVFGVIKYLLVNVLMSLMRGPTEEVNEEPPVHGDQFMVKALTDSPGEDALSSAAITDAGKDESGKMELVTQASVAGVERTGENATEEGSTEQTEQQAGETEPPMTLVSTFHYAVDVKLNCLNSNGFCLGHFQVDLLGGEAAKLADLERSEAQKVQEAAMATIEAESRKSSQQTTEEPPAVNQINFGKYGHRCVSFLTRNFYKLKYAALALAFLINAMLLFYKVTTYGEDGDEDVDDLLGFGSGSGMLGAGSGDDGSGSGDGDGEEEEPLESVHVSEDFFYIEHVLRASAMLHSLCSLCMLIAYYHLKVPLAIFKREKEIARRLEFDGLFIAEQPADDDFNLRWDKLVISAKSFPVNYWDKFVKKKVRQKYSETYDFDSISNLLGMQKSSFATQETDATGIINYVLTIDWRYQVWKAGVTITDNSFLYQLWYFIFSVLGNFNNFFFAAHLLDVAVGFKTLRTILQSVTHNGKQLVLTVLLLTIIVYIYTVIAFNFFRKFYIQEEDDEVDKKCHNMGTCFIFHLYKGVRAGGGIGDEIGDPDGDDYEKYRIIFDITFFFFVIIILLAIIQGLIIDAFGELRDQLESVKDDMESNCFICTMEKSYFDAVPHGFDTHVQQEHNLANYMFFLMHLINKPDTEFTGQETYVWNMYQQRCWDFFPVGDCFRKQNEDKKSGGDE